MCRTLLFAITFVAAAPPAAAQDAESPWRFSLEGSYRFGSVDGYVQTPSGGEPGSSSSKRPTLSEIGIDDASIYDAQAVVAFRNEEFFIGGQYIHMSGSDTLDAPLMSQGRTFAAGSAVSSDVDLDWYRFGYRHRFTLDRGGEWTLTPSIGAAVLDFHYRLRGPAATADRSYIKLNALLGLDAEWRPGHGRFSINADLFGTPPISPPLPEMFVEEIVATYRVLDRRDTSLAVFGGVAFEQIYYEDNQTLPNRISAEFGPMLVVGVGFRF
jgi:hypothetical protein